MALQNLTLDPNAATYTGDQMLTAINGATGTIAAARRPLQASEVTSSILATGAVTASAIVTGTITSALLAAGVAKANLDAMAATARGYIQTSPTTGQYKVVAVQRDSAGKLQVTFDDVAQ
jgi:hypothetical protein